MQSSLKFVYVIGLFLLLAIPTFGEVYYSEFEAGVTAADVLDFSIMPADYQVVSVEINGRAWPVSQFEGGRYSISGFGKIENSTLLKLNYNVKGQIVADDIIINIDGFTRTLPSNRQPLTTIELIPLQAVTDTLDSGIAGYSDIHKIGFNISTNQVLEKGEIWITFAAGFDVGGLELDSISYSDDDAANDGDEPVFDSLNVITRTVILRLDGGTPAAQNSRINIEIKSINNSIIANDYSVTVQTLDSLGTLVHVPTSSAAFTLAPDILDAVVVSPSGAMNVPSDSIVTFTALGEDQYGNIITGVTFTWANTVDSCGSVVNGVFQANKVGQCYITATSGGFSDSSGQITVIPGAVSRFGMTGYPTSRTAGQSFTAPVQITVYDMNDNVVYNPTDSIYFYSDDPQATLTYTSSNWLDIDTGHVSIAGLNFVLKTAGQKTFSLTNGYDTTTSAYITVNPAAIDDFSFAFVGGQTAGVVFSLNVSGAVDQYGNAAGGNILVDDIPGQGGGNSPDGHSPSFSTIVVSNGVGSAYQLLTNAVTTTLEGSVGSVTKQTNAFDVEPGIIGDLFLTEYPDTITVGQTFADQSIDPTVTVKDIYGNLQTNYLGTVSFSGIDNAPGPYTFLVGDAGTHTFSGSAFSFTNVGTRRLIATDAGNGIADTSSAIEVRAAGISSFTISAPPTVTAGTAFTVNITDALDADGNPASGTIVIADSSGAGSSPDGTLPSLNNIVVVNGVGQAQQILVDAGVAILKGTYGGSLVEATGNITVNPATVVELTLTEYPDTITAGQTFDAQSFDPTVTVKDTYGNIATNYTGTVEFTGIENHSAQHTFDGGDAGIHAFPGSDFSFEAAGTRKFIARNLGNTLVDTSSAITVYPDAMNSFTLTAPGSATAGSAFTLNVTSAIDQFGNNASGTIVVEDSLNAGSSPDGTLPSLNNIQVSNGTGSSQQILVNAGTARLKGTYNGTLIRGTADITVNPNNAAELTLSNYPDTIFAGDTFPTDPRITLKDTYGNPATNYNGTVTLSNADSDDLVHSFSPPHSAQYDFDGSLIYFNSTGLRTIIVSDNLFSLTATSAPIRVLSVAIASFTISDPGSVTAGVPFPINITEARDEHGNLTSGTIIISGISGVNPSPDGSEPTLNNIIVGSNGQGTGMQTLVLTENARIRGVSGAFADTTAIITVEPGTVGDIKFTGYPGTITAGVVFPGIPVITMYDLFMNVKTDYNGTVTFTEGDSVPDPFLIDPSDNGQVTIPGNQFRFTVSGMRELIVTESVRSLADTTNPIQVNPDIIDSYEFSPVGAVTAGVPFTLSVINVHDQWGNNTSGTIDIDTVGQANSPNGETPIVNDITATNGSGSALQTLVRTTSTGQLRGSANGFIDSTNVFTVNPGMLGGLVVAVASPQVSGEPFVGTCNVTAKDYYGNTKTNFDASADNITITASTGGPMSNNVLDQAADFASGVADISTTGKNTTYSGPGGQVTFTATSGSGIIGESNPVQIGSIDILSIALDNPEVVNGDLATGEVTIRNQGSVAVSLTNINVIADGTSQNPTYTPALPFSIPAGSNQTFDLEFNTNTSGPGTYPIRTIAIGNYSGTAVGDTLDNGDTLIIVSESNVIDIAGTLAPSIVSRGYNYSIIFDLRNTGGTGLNLVNSSFITFNDGTETYRAELAQNSFISPNDTTTLIFESEPVAGTFNPGTYSINFQIYGWDIHGSVSDLVTLNDNITVQSSVAITYQGNLTPTTLLTGSAVTFSARVRNSGQADLLIDPDQTKLAFSDGTHQFIAYIDTSSSVFVEQISGGTDTTLTFVPELLLPAFAIGDYTPIVTVAGVENDRNYSINASTELIHIYNPGEVRIDSLYTVSYNSPKVNVGQIFTLHGYISNLGTEGVHSVRVLITTDGSSDIIGDSGDTLDIGVIDSLDGVAFNVDIVADSTANPLEAFYCDIVSAINQLSGADSPIATPLDNSSVAILEDKAELWIDTLYLSDDAISTGQQFTVYARVNHQGSNSYSGTSQLALSFDGDTQYQIADSPVRDFTIGQIVSWNVEAPLTGRTSTVRVLFNGNIIDLNDSTTARGADSVTTTINVSDSASISHRACILSPSGALDSVLSTGQSLTVVDSLFPIGNVANSYAKLTLPAGFSSSDPLTQRLTGNAIQWHIRATEQVSTSSLGFDCWCFDINTGDSAGTNLIEIPVEIESKATLSMNSEITYPPSAVDRIITPGGFFTFVAVVSNIGDAATSDGQLTLGFENSGFSAEEALTRDFTPGVPVEWTIYTPDVQLLDGTTVFVTMSTIPTDLNSEGQCVVLNDSTGLEILLKEEIPSLILRDPTPLGGAAVAGQPLDVYRMRLINSTEISTDSVGIYSFGFRLKSSGNVIAPDDVITASTLTMNDASFTGTLEDSVVSFIMDPQVIVEPDSAVTITINVTPVANPAYSSFGVGFQSDDITARVIIHGVAEQYVDIVLPDGEEFDLDGFSLAMLDDNFMTSTKVNQNPYLASEGDLRIGYMLESESSLELKIYNVNGDLVWEFLANGSNGYGSVGQHYDETAVPWDGRNTEGDRVLSGVYYIFVNNVTSGLSTKMKVAVIW